MVEGMLICLGGLRYSLHSSSSSNSSTKGNRRRREGEGTLAGRGNWRFGISFQGLTEYAFLVRFVRFFYPFSVLDDYYIQGHHPSEE